MKAKIHNSHAFSIVELLFALGVIAILTTIIIASRQNTSEKQARHEAQIELTVLSNALEAYRLENGSYPQAPTVTTKILKPLSAKKEYLEGYSFNLHPETQTIEDPWGNPYHYQFSEKKAAHFTLYSLGPNAEDAKDDIVHKS